MFRRLLALSLPYLPPPAASTAPLVRLDVSQNAGVYEIRVEMDLDAAAGNVRAVLTDYANPGRLSSSITSSEIINTGREDTVRVRTHLRNCVLFFCRSLQTVEDVTEDSPGRTRVTIVPGSSSFRSGQASWEMQNLGSRSRGIHYATLEPDPWIPPWMGTAILKDAVRREITRSISMLDCLARARREADHSASRKHGREDAACHR